MSQSTKDPRITKYKTKTINSKYQKRNKYRKEQLL